MDGWMENQQQKNQRCRPNLSTVIHPGFTSISARFPPFRIVQLISFWMQQEFKAESQHKTGLMKTSAAV